MSVRYSPVSPAINLDDLEKGTSAHLAEFADRQVRAGFMRKVFGLLAVQLAVTTVLGAACVFSAPIKAFLNAYPVVPMSASLGALVILLVFAFSESARSSHPTNLWLLLGFTVCESVVVGLVSSRYEPIVVLAAFGMTAAVASGLAIYALRTKHDFTMMGGMLYAMLMSLMLALIMGAAFHVPLYGLGFSLIGAALFSAYLVYDIQLLMGGNHQHKVSPDDYVMATVSIYLDIINLFLHILRILGEMRRD